MGIPVTYFNGHLLDNWHYNGVDLLRAYCNNTLIFEKTLVLYLPNLPNYTQINLRNFITDSSRNPHNLHNVRVVLRSGYHHPTIYTGDLSGYNVTLEILGSLEAGVENRPALSLSSTLRVINNGYIRGSGGRGGNGGKGAKGKGSHSSGWSGVTKKWHFNSSPYYKWEYIEVQTSTQHYRAWKIYWGDGFYDPTYTKIEYAPFGAYFSEKVIGSHRYIRDPDGDGIQDNGSQPSNVVPWKIGRQTWTVHSVAGGEGGNGGTGGIGQWYKRSPDGRDEGDNGQPGGDYPATAGGKGGYGGAGGSWGNWGEHGERGHPNHAGEDIGQNGTGGGSPGHAIVGSSHLTPDSILNNNDGGNPDRVQGPIS